MWAFLLSGRGRAGHMVFLLSSPAFKFGMAPNGGVLYISTLPYVSFIFISLELRPGPLLPIVFDGDGPRHSFLLGGPDGDDGPHDGPLSPFQGWFALR